MVLSLPESPCGAAVLMNACKGLKLQADEVWRHDLSIENRRILVEAPVVMQQLDEEMPTAVEAAAVDAVPASSTDSAGLLEPQPSYVQQVGLCSFYEYKLLYLVLFF